MTFDPVLVEKVATLLYLVMEDNPSMPRLYLTGVFFFVLMYTGSNVLPVARFLKYTHLKQAFRSDEVNHAVGRSSLKAHLHSARRCASKTTHRDALPTHIDVRPDASTQHDAHQCVS